MLISEQMSFAMELGMEDMSISVSILLLHLFIPYSWVRSSQRKEGSAKELFSPVTLFLGLLFSKTLEADSHLVLSVVFMLYYFLNDLLDSIDRDLLINEIHRSAMTFQIYLISGVEKLVFNNKKCESINTHLRNFLFKNTENMQKTLDTSRSTTSYNK